MSPTQEKLPNQIPRTAEEMVRAEHLARERKERGDREAMTELSTQMEGFIQNASPDNLRRFITIVCAGSPEAQKEYGQLCTYFNTKALELAKHPKAGKNPDQKPTTEHSAERITERPAEPLVFSKFETKGDVNGVSVPMLSTEAYVALKTTETNPDALAKFIASDDLSSLESRKRQARDELEKQKIHIINSGNYPQGWDSAVNFHEESFKKQAEVIVAKHRPNAEAFKKSLNTDQGRYLLENTERVLIESGIKSNIRKWLGISENAGPKESTWEKLTGEIYGKTTDLLRKIGSLKDSINRDIEAIRAQHATMLRAGGNEMVYQQALAGVPARYEQVVKNDIRAYAKDVGSHLLSLDPVPQVVVQKQRFSLPIWGKNVTLDFSNLWNVNVQDKKALKASFESNFDSIYRETIPQKTFDSIKSGAAYVKDHPAEVWVDVGSIVVSGIATVLFMESTANTSVFVAGPVFTATNNAVSAAGYGIIGASRGKDFKKEALAGINIQDSDKPADILRKKTFELASNTVLFGTFKATAISEKVFKEAVASLAGKTLTPELMATVAKNPIFKGVNKIGTPTLKTTAETTFFTYYIALSTGVDNALKEVMKSGATPSEAIEVVRKEFDKVKDIDTFLDYYAYNLGFILSVKWGTKIGEHFLSKPDNQKLSKSTMEMEQEKTRLESKGYSFATRPDGGFFVFDPYGHRADLKSPDLASFVKTNKEIFDLSIKLNPNAQQKINQKVNEPDSGRGGKTATNPTNLEQKFVNLARNSAEAERGGLKYALRDEVVYSRLEQTGVSDGVGVKEGLLQKSGFEEFEIRDYREGKKEWSNEVERDALKKMEVASEKIAKEYDHAQKIIYERLKKWVTDKEALAEYKWVELTRMLNLIFR